MERKPRVYWNGKGILIFDAGYEGGDLHIYQEIDAKPAQDMKEVFRHYKYNPDYMDKWELKRL